MAGVLDLYARGMATLLALWEAYARLSPGAAVQRLPGVTAAIFPDAPERDVYNNAVLARGCQTASLQATPMAERVYAAAGF